jgi:hypothetical protein
LLASKFRGLVIKFGSSALLTPDRAVIETTNTDASQEIQFLGNFTARNSLFRAWGEVGA